MLYMAAAGRMPQGEPGTIGYHSLRAGNIPKQPYAYIFGGMGERLEITHHSYNWECFARGACDCAAYLADKAAGILYDSGCIESVALHFRQKNTIISLYQLPICRATYMMLGSKEEHSE